MPPTTRLAAAARPMATRPRRPPRRPLIPPGAAALLAVAAVALLPFLLLLAPRPPYTVAALAPAAPSASSGRAPHPDSAGEGRPVTHTVRYDRYSLLVDGRRVVLFGGEYQFWRTPSPARWPVVLAEMRAAGLNAVSVGVSWQYHSPAPGVYDFSGIRDLGRFLDDAAAAGLYVIARPGPAYDAESNASNLPGWLLARAGNLRANAGRGYCGAGAYSPAYAAAYTDWYRHVLPIIAARQLARGRGTVVAMQIENEYNPACGSARYMRDLHDLARRAGITVPLIANNNACCVAAGAWHAPGDDGRPVVDIPAEDDYPCMNLCAPAWDRTPFAAVDSLEARTRAAGVTAAPIAVAELQGGYFTGWGGPSYDGLAAALGPAFDEVLDGSALGQGATLVSVYMAAGGTSWGYLGGPNTATSYDYAAPIHEWGAPGPAYAALKRTGMFVDAFGDLLGATERTTAVAASNPSLLYAARRALDGPQRGAELIVLRNTNPARGSATTLTFPVMGRSETVPHVGTIALPPHALALLVAGYRLGPFDLLYSTSRPLTHAAVGGDEVAVLYGTPGTAGETALLFDHAPRIERLDGGITARYDAARHELLLDYQHTEGLRYAVLSTGGRRLVLALTGLDGAAHVWRATTAAGTTLISGPSMVTSLPSQGSLQVQMPPGTATPVTVWTAQGSVAPRATDGRDGTAGAQVHVAGLVPPPATHPNAQAPRIETFTLADTPSSGKSALVRQGGVRYDPSTGALGATLTTLTPALRLPTLTSWRFMPESPESRPSFDDARWTPATERATTNPNVPPGDTLLADDYGFHYGFVWYRGTFVGTGTEDGLRLFARHSYSVWLNGRYLGSSSLDNDRKDASDELAVGGSPPTNATYADGLTFPIAPGLVRAGAPNTVAVLVESLGHNIGFANGELSRSPMGILSAQLVGPAAGFTAPAISWKLDGGSNDTGSTGTAGFQPAPGGSMPAGSRRSQWPPDPLNASGLYGERNGWYRPDFDDSAWPTVSVPDDWAARGLRLQGIGWYRATFDLDLPAGVDAPLGLTIPRAQDKVLIWLNGLLIGRYWDQAGPQHTFYLPAGLLREHGRNTLALAVWNRGHDGGLTGGVALQPYTISAQATLRVGSS